MESNNPFNNRLNTENVHEQEDGFRSASFTDDQIHNTTTIDPNITNILVSNNDGKDVRFEK